MGYLSAIGIPDEQERIIAGSLLIGSLWTYAANVFYPAQPLKRLGVYRPPHIGTLPPAPDRPGLGAHFSRRCPFPVLLESRPEHYDLVDEFDHIAHDYETYIKPFSEPVMAEALQVMQPFFTPSSRVIDSSLRRRYGIDAVGAARAGGRSRRRRSRRRNGTDHVSTSTVGGPRQHGILSGRRRAFADRIHGDVRHHILLAGVSSLSGSASGCARSLPHFAARWVCVCRRCRARVVQLMSNWLAKWADPGWIGFHSGDEFKAMFEVAGFSHFHWQELLPGMGLVAAMK